MEEKENRGPEERDEPDQDAGEDADAGEDSGDTPPKAQQEVEASLEPLGEGSTLSVGFAELPVRSLVAMALFVAVFMVVWMILWAVGGGLGLGLGWILAAGVGALAVKLYADRSK
jgi:hypothetical protein